MDQGDLTQYQRCKSRTQLEQGKQSTADEVTGSQGQARKQLGFNQNLGVPGFPTRPSVSGKEWKDHGLGYQFSLMQMVAHFLLWKMGVVTPTSQVIVMAE